MERAWNGVTRREGYNAAVLAIRDALADAAEQADWSAVLATLASQPMYVNSWRPGGSSWFTPLHHAAQLAAPREVVERLVELGAWRTLRCSRGERPVDIARSRGNSEILDLLEPIAARPVRMDLLGLLQAELHAVIRSRADALVAKHALRLPELEVLTEQVGLTLRFMVPGMHGGFTFWLEQAGDSPMLISRSWCRVVEGSGQRHEVTPAGSRLVAEDVW